MIEFILTNLVIISYLAFIARIQKYPYDDGYMHIDTRTKILLTIASILCISLLGIILINF